MILVDNNLSNFVDKRSDVVKSTILRTISRQSGFVLKWSDEKCSVNIGGHTKAGCPVLYILPTLYMIMIIMYNVGNI